MILGMSTATYTFLHVLISLIGIGSGFVVMFGFITGKRLDTLTAVFLTTTVLTSVTGFGFPFDHLLPSHKLGIISLVVLALRSLRATSSILRVHGDGSTSSELRWPSISMCLC